MAKVSDDDIRCAISNKRKKKLEDAVVWCEETGHGATEAVEEKRIEAIQRSNLSSLLNERKRKRAEEERIDGENSELSPSRKTKARQDMLREEQDYRRVKRSYRLFRSFFDF